MKIPFFIVKNFISPLVCENIMNDLKIHKMEPTYGQDGFPKKMILANRLNEIRIMQIFDNYVEKLENHFDFEYLGTYSLMFEWFPEGCKAEKIKSDGYVKEKNGDWKRYKNVDFTGILFLNDYEDTVNFDDDFDVNGGKLVFPNFDISFNPERGTFIVFPVAPNFVHTTSDVRANSLTQIRFTIRATVPYQFNKEQFLLEHEKWSL